MKEGLNTGALCLGLAALVLAQTAAADDDDASAWLKDRTSRFVAYQAAHPNPDAEIAAIKAKTSAAILGHRTALNADPALDRAPVIWPASSAPVELWDGADYPEMIVVPAGEYTMGSTMTEVGHQASEAPRHRVRIGYSFAVGKYPITVGEFARFVSDTGYQAGDQCYTNEGFQWEIRKRDWRRIGFEQTSSHPAGCLSWKDAQAYTAWLSRKTGHAYRLLSDAEYEYANRAGSTTAYWWGEDVNAACAFANGDDPDAKVRFPQATTTCHDSYFVFTAPVGSFKPNAFGLYDMTGNGWSWLSDCWNDTYNGAPTDGSANGGGDCDQRVLRGASWSRGSSTLRAALRYRHQVDYRVAGLGFRVAITL